MDTTSNFRKYEKAIRSAATVCTDENLLLAREGALAAYYAPLDWVNPSACVALVGITPGKTQANNALTEARKALAESAEPQEVIARAKRIGAFSGTMRGNLISLLDRVGIHTFLGLNSSTELFGRSGHLLQSMSILPFPVLVDGKDYNGTPDPIRTPFLNQLTEKYFVPMVRELPKAVFIPLGPVPTKVLHSLADRGSIDRSRILDGLPHPSGANAERIAYFLGLKAKELLSAKTDPKKLDDAKRQLLSKLALLPSPV